jgi:hypothetical protein
VDPNPTWQREEKKSRKKASSGDKSNASGSAPLSATVPGRAEEVAGHSQIGVRRNAEGTNFTTTIWKVAQARSQAVDFIMTAMSSFNINNGRPADYGLWDDFVSGDRSPNLEAVVDKIKEVRSQATPAQAPGSPPGRR